MMEVIKQSNMCRSVVNKIKKIHSFFFNVLLLLLVFSDNNLYSSWAVPPLYPIDEDLMKLCIVNQLQRLGLAEHFLQEIKDVLAQVYRYYGDVIKKSICTIMLTCPRNRLSN